MTHSNMLATTLINFSRGMDDSLLEVSCVNVTRMEVVLLRVDLLLDEIVKKKQIE